jgi:arylsulfatase A-like enzyme
MVILDALRRQSVGTRIKDSPVTPTINRFKDSAMNFKKYYVQAPWTKPSTASLFTGLYLREHATFLGLNPDDSIRDNDLFYGQPLPDRFRTLAERLSQNDVETFGAVSIGHISSEYQYDQGFKRWFNPGETSSGRTDYAAVQRLLFWYQRERPDKSFSYLHLSGPHYPYAQSLYNLDYWKKTKFYSHKGFKVPGKNFPHPKEMSKFTLPPTKDKVSPEQIEFLRHLYRSQLNLHDQKIVRPLLNGLEKMGVMDSSYVVLGSDHGEELFDYSKFGHKRNLREPVISPPLIVRYPGGDPRGSSGRMLESIDLTATILDWMNSDTEGISGSSFAGHPQKSDDSQEAYVEMGKEIYLYRDKNRKRIDLRGYDLGVSVALVRKGPWKFYHEYSDDQNVLINLDHDPGEKTALTNRPEVTQKFRERIFKVLGSDSDLLASPSPLLKGSETHGKNLRGLGYL